MQTNHLADQYGASPVTAKPAARFSESRLIARSVVRDPLAVIGLVVILVAILGAIFAPYVSPYAEQGRGDPSILDKFKPPSQTHILGTDYLGRDVLARLLYGARSSLSTGFLVVIIAVLVGTPLGAIAGYFGGWLDEVIMRITDIFLTLPQLPLLRSPPMPTTAAATITLPASSITAAASLRSSTRSRSAR